MVGIFGTSSQQGKFSLQLALKKELEDREDAIDYINNRVTDFLINLSHKVDLDDEKIIGSMPVYDFEADKYVTIFTKYGMVKRTKLIDFKVGRYSKEICMISLKDDDLVFGLTVVTKKSGGGEDWKTDFGAEYQKTVTGSEWTTLSWDLNSLFGVSSKEALENITIKAKSKAASTEGYEMNFLVDNIDIVNEGGTPIPPQPSTDRGEVITSGEDTTITLNEHVELTDKISVDLKLDKTNTTGKVSIALLDNTNWDDYYGYYSFFSNGTMQNTTTGVTISSLNDGYFRVTFNLPEMVKIHGANLPSTFIDTVYVRGAWTDINGRIDVNPPSDVTVVRGDRFTAGQDCTLEFKSAPLPIDQPITVDLKFDEANSNKKISIMLGQGWNQYYGYFKINSNGTLGDTYNGVSIEALTDGYYRVTMNTAQLTKVNDMPAPDSYINLFYLSKSRSTASGLIELNPSI